MRPMKQTSDISAVLIEWYGRHFRPLPWRETSDPYLIWLSEVILQQTRVAQGLDYFRRFASRFPDVRSLAAATEDEVLKLWQGLGYYSRARSLHAAARRVAERFDGVFPTGYDDVRSLPGVGDYTASAVCSIAYGQPCAVVDGNVYRVLSRLTDADVPMLYAWMLRNDQYFRYCGGGTTPERVRQDLTFCPPGTAPAQKHYVGFFDADTLVAVMDLIDGYPDADTAFIGFFMMNKDLQGQGTGTAIVRDVLAALRALGYTAVRLGIDKGNPQSNHFWRKNGFTVLREAAQERGIVLLAERRLA